MRDQIVEEASIARIAERQGGVIGARQLRALGVSKHAVHHRVHAGRLHVIHRGVYAVGHRRLDALGWR